MWKLQGREKQNYLGVMRSHAWGVRGPHITMTSKVLREARNPELGVKTSQSEHLYIGPVGLPTGKHQPALLVSSGNTEPLSVTVSHSAGCGHGTWQQAERAGLPPHPGFRTPRSPGATMGCKVPVLEDCLMGPYQGPTAGPPPPGRHPGRPLLDDSLWSCRGGGASGCV